MSAAIVEELKRFANDPKSAENYGGQQAFRRLINLKMERCDELEAELDELHRAGNAAFSAFVYGEEFDMRPSKDDRNKAKAARLDDLQKQIRDLRTIVASQLTETPSTNKACETAASSAPKAEDSSAKISIVTDADEAIAVFDRISKKLDELEKRCESFGGKISALDVFSLPLDEEGQQMLNQFRKARVAMAKIEARRAKEAEARRKSKPKVKAKAK